MPLWAQALAPIAEHVAHVLGQAMAGKYQPATPLTRSRTRTAQAVGQGAQGRRRGRQLHLDRARQRPTGARPAPRCGAAPTVADRSPTAATSAATRASRPTPHRRLRCRGRRGAAISARKRALREWEEANPGVAYDPDLFRREILPGLATVKLADIMAAAGISKGYASDVRAGKFTPHVSTWEALADLVKVGRP